MMMVLLVLLLAPLSGLLEPFPRGVVPATRGASWLPGPARTWDSDWVGVLPTSISADAVWPYSVGILVKLVAFLGTLHCVLS